MEHLLERRGAADLADLRVRIGHAMEHLEQMPVRTAEFVDRHGKIKASRGIRRLPSARMVRHSMDETATTLPARATGLPRFRAATDELDRRLFVGGVSAITLAVAVFLFVQLDKWPPHEDETLPLFVGRHSLTDAFDIVLAKRGGAPLHFLLAWIVAHTGGGLHEMRLLSALFAVASIPAIAILGNRLAGRAPALAAAALAAGSWVLLFHGIYARMYSLFLLLSTLSYLALLRALKRRRLERLGALGPDDAADDRRAPVRRARPRLAGALTSSPPGERWRQAIPAFAAVGVLAIPLWRASLVLADRYDVGGGGSSGALSTPHQVFAYLWHVAGDSSSGYTGVLVVYLLLAVVGLAFLARDRPRGALLVAMRRPDADALLPDRQVRRQLGARSLAT